MDAVTALIGIAGGASGRGAQDEAARLMSRIFRELSASDQRHVTTIMVDSWLATVRALLAPAELARAQEWCQQGVAAVGAEHLLDATRCFAEARAVVGGRSRTNPAIDLLALGTATAAKLAIEDQKREAAFQELVDRAGSLLVTPGKSDEAIVLLEQARGFLADPPRTAGDRVRAERLQRLIDEHRRAGSAGSGDPEVALPPPAALTHEGWNMLGERMVGASPRAALTCFERAIAADPTVGRYWLNKANLLLQLEAGAAAIIEAYAKAAGRDPDDIRPWVGLAAALQEADRFAEAVEAWGHVLRLQPGVAAAVAHRATCVSAAALLTEGAGWDLDRWLARGTELIQAKEWALAATCFNRALAASPRNVSALSGKAVARWRQAMEARAQGGAGRTAQFGVRLGDAIDCLRAVLEVEPGNAAARDLLKACEDARQSN
jgi:tetratricopeptide (TPR) repeat protein